MRVVACVVVLVAGCGRYAFESHDASVTGDAPHDTSPADMGDTSDAAPACLASYRLCDGFESGINTTTWMVDPGVSLDTAIAHRGTASVRAHINAINAGQNMYQVLYEFNTLPLGDPTVYVRAYVRLGSLPAINNRMELISATQTAIGGGGDYLFLHDTEFAVYTQYSTAVMQNGMLPRTNTWLCVLWTVVRSTGSTGSIALAGDPTAATVTGTQTDGSPPIDEMAFGIGFSGTNVATAQPAMDVWIDDVIIAPSPVTCAD